MVKKYISENSDRFLKELFELLKIPSVSADSKFKGDVRAAANWVKDELIKSGADFAELKETKGHPIVYGEKYFLDSAPTILVYGHYDVQPADPYELWETPPFEPTIRNGKIYARGSADDKGQMYMHIKALEVLTKLDALKCNVKFMIEGEEEIGSNNLEIFVKENKELLSADVILISDTGIISMENPSITIGLRGLSYVEVEVTGPNRDLHSGMYGGAVNNPINALSKMIASLQNENGTITIPGFYDDVEILSENERAELNNAPYSEAEYKKELNINSVHGEKGFTTVERTSIRPTLDVNGIWGGYIGEGAKTVLPSKAFAKISMRLVPNQDSHTIAELFKKHFESIAPEGIRVKVKPHHGGEPAVVPSDSKALNAAKKAFENVWNKKPFLTREGGSIPIVALFKKELGLDSVLMGFGLDSDAIHSPNESYGIKNFLIGIETICSFYEEFQKD